MESKFLIIRKSPWGVIGNRVLAPFELPEASKQFEDNRLFVCAIIKVTEDFNLSKSNILTSDTDSVQIRPKQVFKNTKGYFYKISGSPVYLDSEEVEEYLRYLSNNKDKIIKVLETKQYTYEID